MNAADSLTHIRLLAGSPHVMCSNDPQVQTISFQHFFEGRHPAGASAFGHVASLRQPLCEVCERTAWSFISGSVAKDMFPSRKRP